MDKSVPVVQPETNEVVAAACRVFSRAYSEHRKGSPRRCGATYAGIAAVLAAQHRPVPDAQTERLRAALATLIGASDVAELRGLELAIRCAPAPAEDKAAMIDAIHALIATAPSAEVAHG